MQVRSAAATRAMRIGISAFSSAVNSGSRWWNWKTKPTWRLRNATSSASDSSRSARPAIRMLPPSIESSPPSTCSSVLLPTPEAPTMATISPFSTDDIEVAQHAHGASAV